MTTFGHTDFEETMRGRMADLPTFDTYNVQYEPLSTVVHDHSLHHVHAPDVYSRYIPSFAGAAAAPTQNNFGSSSRCGYSTNSLDAGHSQLCGSEESEHQRFWESASGFDDVNPSYIGGTSAGGPYGVPSSVSDWHTRYSHFDQYHTPQFATIPPSTLPFTSFEMSSLPSPHLPSEISYSPNQADAFGRHAATLRPSMPRLAIPIDPYCVTLQPIPPEYHSRYSVLSECLGHLQVKRRSGTRSEDQSSAAVSVNSQSPSSTLVSSSLSKRPRSPSPSLPASLSASTPGMLLPKDASQTRSAATLDEATATNIMTTTDIGSDNATGAKPKRARTIEASESLSSISTSSSAMSPPPAEPFSLAEKPLLASTEPTQGVRVAPPVTKYKNVKQPRKPSLACLFCRERKIACGRPPDGSADKTCNQCARRKYTCVYLTEKPRRVRKKAVKPMKPKVATT